MDFHNFYLCKLMERVRGQLGAKQGLYRKRWSWKKMMMKKKKKRTNKEKMKKMKKKKKRN